VAPLSDPAVIDRLISLVDEGGDVALAAADALGTARLPPDRAAPLLRAFADAEPAVEARLCPALATNAAGVARLVKLLDDAAAPDQVRAAAAWAAGSAADARPALRRAATDPVPAVAANARAALASGGGPAGRAPSWTGVRLMAPDGTPWPSRWLAVAAADGTEVWTMTDGSGRARLSALPAAPLELRLVEGPLAVRPPPPR
jgi:hypothetical protein